MEGTCFNFDIVTTDSSCALILEGFNMKDQGSEILLALQREAYSLYRGE